jgi:hypothetical protein
LDATEIIIPPPDIDFSEEPESQAGPSEPIDQQSDKTSDILPLALSPDTDDSDMPTISGPTYKAKAPKNVWSPGSTSNSSSSTQTTIPATAHRTSTPEPESLPDSFRPSKLLTVIPHKQSERLTDAHITSLSPTISEATPEFNDNQIENITDIYDPQSPPIHKYWTLPRNIATATKLKYQIEDEQQLQQQHQHKRPTTTTPTAHIHRQIISDLPPPSSAKYLFETEDTKYFTLPSDDIETVTKTRKVVIPAPPKSEGIGPVTESGIPIALKSGVKDEYASDWYKAWVKKMHKFDRPHTQEDEPIRVKLKSTKYKGRDYRLTPGLNEDESKLHRSVYMPKNIADYEPGHSSISEREKQMFYKDIFNYIDSIFAEVFSTTFQVRNPIISSSIHSIRLFSKIIIYLFHGFLLFVAFRPLLCYIIF